ncbi:MAG: hypothetical protein LUC22_03995 [Prevotella sp.]|nr:hypothetical protein [Prevotella sp.]
MPAESLEAYKADTNWTNVCRIFAIDGDDGSSDPEVTDITITTIENGTTLTSSVSTIEISCESRFLSLNENYSGGGITITNTTQDKTVTISDITFLCKETGSTCTLTPESSIGAAYTGVGSYTMTIPAGIFCTDKNQTVSNTEVVLSFTVGGVEFNPLSGSTIEEGTISEIVVRSDSQITAGTAAISGVTVKKEDSATTLATGNSLSCEESARGDGYYYATITLSTELTYDYATLVVTIPKNTFSSQTEEMTATYYIDANPGVFTYTFVPSEEYVAENAIWRERILIDCEKGIAPVDEECTDVVIKSAYSSGSEVARSTSTTLVSGGCAIYFDNNYGAGDGLSYNFNYNVIIPAGTFYVGTLLPDYNGETNDEITIHYQYSNGTDPQVTTYTVTPANYAAVAGSLSQVSLSGDEWMSLADGADLSTITVTNEDDETVANGASITWDTQGVYVSTCTITLDKEITDPGTYTINIPAGLFNINEPETVTNEAVTSEFNIVAFTFTPEAGSQLTSALAEITIEGSAALELGESVQASSVIVTDANGEQLTTGTGDVTILNDYEYTITLADEVSEACTVTIPAGFFTCLDTDLTVEYTFGPSVETVRMTFTDPVNGGVSSVVSGMSGISISQVSGTTSAYLEVKDQTYTASNGYDGSSIIITDDEGSQVTTCATRFGFSWDEGEGTTTGAFALKFASSISTPGTYTLTIPEGFFYTNSKHTGISAEITTTFVIAEWTFTDPEPYSTSAEVTLEELSTITLTCTYPFHIATGNEASDIILYSLGDAGGMNEATTVSSIDWNGDADANGDYTSCTFNLAETMTEDATYNLRIPEGFFNILDVDLDQTWKVEHRVPEDLIVVISPADGDKVEEIYDNITLACEDGMSLSHEVNYSAIVIKDENGEEVATCSGAEASYASGEEDTSDPSFYTLTFSTVISTLTGYNVGDKFTLYVPYNVFILGRYSTPNEEMSATYTLVSSDETLDLSLSPVAGVVAELSDITVSYSGGLLAGRSSNASDITLTDEDGNVISATSCEPVESTLTSNDDYTEYVITFDPEITTDGTYVLTIPADFFALTIGGGTSYYNNDETTATYIVEYDGIVRTVEVTPADGETVASLRDVKFAHTPINLATDAANITVTDASGNVVATGVSGSYGDIELNEDNNIIAITIPLTETIATNGVYTIAVPKNAFYLDANETVLYEKAITVTVTVDTSTGINAVSADELDGAEIYNLAGQRVNTPVCGTVNIIKYADGTVKKVLIE